MQLYPGQRKEITYPHDNGVMCIKHLPPTRLDDLYFKHVFWPFISPVLNWFNVRRVIKPKYYKDITDIEIDGIDYKDHPDYCDAYIASATWRSSLTPLTEAQLDQLNNDSCFVHESVWEHLY